MGMKQKRREVKRAQGRGKRRKAHLKRIKGKNGWALLNGQRSGVWTWTKTEVVVAHGGERCKRKRFAGLTITGPERERKTLPVGRKGGGISQLQTQNQKVSGPGNYVQEKDGCPHDTSKRLRRTKANPHNSIEFKRGGRPPDIADKTPDGEKGFGVTLGGGPENEVPVRGGQWNGECVSGCKAVFNEEKKPGGASLITAHRGNFSTGVQNGGENIVARRRQ